jgi:tRNA-specific adenosine deaminase 1
MNISGSGERYASSQVSLFYGGTYFQGRGDSPRTLSKSCSDKLALVSCTSLLNSLLSSIIDPSSCYLDYLIVPQSAYHEAGFRRAFVERLKSIPHDTWPHRFRIQPIQTLTTTYLIPPSLTPPKHVSQMAFPTALTSVIYVKNRPTEVMLGGVRMGSQFPPNGRGASYLCRARMGQDFFHVIQRDTARVEVPLECTYAELKRKAGRGTEPIKHSVREGFGGWTANDSDVDFTLVASHCSVDGS